MQMTRPGALRLKKSSIKIVKRLFSLWGAVLLFSLLFSCKSSPSGYKVNPLDLLAPDNSFYMTVPKTVDPSLLEKVMKDNIPDISDKDIETALNRIDKAYIGLTNNKKTSTYQCAVSCNIPKSFVPNIFSKKKGFSKTVYTSEKSPLRKFDIYSNEEITVSVPDSSLLLLGRGIPAMLDTYVELSETGAGSSAEESLFVSNEDKYEYLSSASDEIRFFANNPQTFLTMFTGVNLDLKLKCVSGAMKPDPESEDQYIMDLVFDFKNTKFIKAGRALLSLAFGLTDSTNEMNSPTELSVSGVKLSKKQVYKLITF